MIHVGPYTLLFPRIEQDWCSIDRLIKSSPYNYNASECQTQYFQKKESLECNSVWKHYGWLYPNLNFGVLNYMHAYVSSRL